MASFRSLQLNTRTLLVMRHTPNRSHEQPQIVRSPHPNSSRSADGRRRPTDHGLNAEHALGRPPDLLGGIQL